MRRVSPEVNLKGGKGFVHLRKRRFEMKRVMSVMVALVLVVGIAGVASADNPNATTPRYLAWVPDEHMPVLDGVLDEWDWVPEGMAFSSAGYWDVDPGTWPRLLGSEEPTADDFSVPFAFWGWNQTANVVVIAGQVIDDIGFGYDLSWGDTWRGVDTIYMYFDADHDHGVYQYEEGKNAEEAQQMICRPDLYEQGVAAAVFTHYSGGCENAWTYAEPHTKVGYVWDYDTGSYTIEATFTLWDWADQTVGEEASIKHILVPGQIIGMRFGYYDVDPDESWAYFTVNAPSIADNAFTSDGFENFLTLTAEETGIVAVESTSWGEIKSLFR